MELGLFVDGFEIVNVLLIFSSPCLPPSLVFLFTRGKKNWCKFVTLVAISSIHGRMIQERRKFSVALSFVA